MESQFRNSVLLAAPGSANRDKSDSKTSQEPPTEPRFETAVSKNNIAAAFNSYQISADEKNNLLTGRGQDKKDDD